MVGARELASGGGKAGAAEAATARFVDENTARRGYRALSLGWWAELLRLGGGGGLMLGKTHHFLRFFSVSSIW